MNTTSAAATQGAADWRDLDLADGGRSLIEASAGTGKTWTIAVLYLRLLLERGLSPRQIVVTTFTDAAAQELRERLRGKLHWAVSRATADEMVCTGLADDGRWLHARWQHDPACRAGDLARLRLALADLDVAPINTLHSLCRRILTDHPFACGVTFAMGDMVASDALLDEVATDLWRRLQQGDEHDALLAMQLAAAENLTLPTLKARLKLCLAPGVTIEVKTPVTTERDLPAEWATRLRKLTARSEFFRQGSVLCRSWNELAGFIEDHSTLLSSNAMHALKEARELKGILKAGQENPEIRAAADFSVRAASFIEEALEQQQRRFWHAVTGFARQEMQSRLQARHQLTFDDLLGKVSGALQREAVAGGARPLADALFAAWPIALVDEFQDTDALQYGILDAIYRDAEGGKRGRLVMIGDPKQAIYRFRGGDIHAYQRAADEADADGRLTLGVNHRSSSALVDAFNEFYAAGGALLSALDRHRISYQLVIASDHRRDAPYTVDGAACAQPLQIHYQPQPPDAAAERCSAALEVCANQIAELLQSGRHRIGGRAVQPSDLAVLLPTGRNIGDLRDLLLERGVPCVTSAKTSVFDTDLARELQVVLYAVAHDAELGALRAAVATRLWGASFSQLQQWGEAVESWQPVTRMFRDWHEAWRERGIQYVVEALIERMAPRYLETLGGERALTDLRHLGEMLQEQSETLGGTEELLAWFNDCREGDALAGGDAAEAAQLRIESDSPRVRLMTLHASKGLEFPIVFLPLMWNHGERAGAGPYVVNDTSSGRRTAEFSGQAKTRELLDMQDERFRVLYVALTRAIYACHVYVLPPTRSKQARASGPAAGTARSALDVMLERMQPPLLSPALGESTPHILWSEGWEPVGRCNFTALPVDNEPRQVRALPARPSGPLAARHSFTTLTQEGRRAAIDPDASAGDELDTDAAGVVTDELPEPATAPVAPIVREPHVGLQALAAVRGTDFGNAVHAIFEHREPGVPMSGQRELIERCLDDAGVRRRDIDQATLIDALAGRIQGALDAPLGLRDDPSFCLADLPAEDLRAEMEFHFPLDRVSMQALQQACSQHGEPGLVPRSSRVLSGLMNGKIDLVFHHAGRFHVLDYKGNYLGDRVADYQGDALLDGMDHSDYRFQALLYTVALDRYLRQRVGTGYRRSLQLGACIYLFIRAAGLASDAGIWRHRFPDALLDAVAAVLSAHDLAQEPA